MNKKIIGIFVYTLLIATAVIPIAGSIEIVTTSSFELINTSVDTISPYNIPDSPLIITATGPSDLDNVTLYYRQSFDNQSWGEEAITYETGIIEDVNGWTMVNLDNSYDNPVVIVTGQEGADISLDVEKSRPRIRDINSDNFEVIVTNELGTTVTEDVGYIVMEKGHWVVDGVEVEAGTYNVSSISTQDITFIKTFPDDTVVVDTIQEESVIGSSRYTEDSMDSTGFSVSWEEYDVDFNNIGPVTAGYIAVEYGSSSNIFESGIQQEVDDDPDSNTWSSITFSNSYSSTPIFFTNPLDEYGGDPCVVGRANLDSSGVDVRVTEGENEDSELSHAPCDIPWIVWTEVTVKIESWNAWVDSGNPDSSYPWSWGFDFPDDTGFYEFYSIGKKAGEVDEDAPLVADALCRFNRMPEIFDESPKDGSTGVELVPQLDISISDADGDVMTVDWLSNCSGSWQVFATDSDVVDGTYSQFNDDFDMYETTYWWFVSVADDIYSNSSPVFHFTTQENLPPYVPSDPDPEDGETNVPVEGILQWSGGDPNSGDTVTYDVYLGKSSPPPLVEEGLSQPAYDPETMDLDATYYWQVVARDRLGESTTGPIWHFATELEPNGPPLAPEIYGSSRGPPGKDLSWGFSSDDPDDNQVKYMIDWGDGNSEETDYYQDSTLIDVHHTYEAEGDYTIKAKAEDVKGLVSEESTFNVKITVSRSRFVYRLLFLWLFERFPLLEKLVIRL